jgi:hypothetical protein
LLRASRWFFWILSRQSSPSFAAAANSGQRITAACTSSMIDSARPRFMTADFAHDTKSSRVKPSRLPFSVIWCVAVQEPEGL